jgi:hypothetical protein
MLDDNKRVHPLKLWLTEREYVDLCKLADQEDRKNSESARVIVRRHMYGHIGPAPAEFHGANSAHEGHDPV